TGGSGTYATWAWNFGDGTAGVGTSVSHTYPSTGSYAVTATVTDSDGISALSNVLNISVTSALTVTASANITSGPAPLSVAFTSAPSGGQGTYVSYLWNFGDNTTSSLPDPTHIYSTAGKYDATVTVTDGSGHQATSPGIPLTVVPGVLVLTNVTMTPPGSQVAAGASRLFSATAHCGTAACPAGVTFAWSLNNTLGTLTNSTSPKVTFTAGPTLGRVSILVQASLNGTTVKGSPASILITPPPLLYVTVSPGAPILAPGGSVALGATPDCGTVPCPTSVSYQWSLNHPLGTLSASGGATVQFTAGASVGTVLLFVNATLNGTTVQSSPVQISIVTPTGGGTTPLVDNPFLWIGVGLMVALVLVAIVLLFRKRKRETSEGYPVYPGWQSPPPGYYPPPQENYPPGWQPPPPEFR
ncbi:MAG: PKD domain-containing protein, partial [Candidatus Thermoplasmatota archaeon]|nr:PKD domain-containing protein [Candidatus Thermoplasmatota archaeon]